MSMSSGARTRDRATVVSPGCLSLPLKTTTILSAVIPYALCIVIPSAGSKGN